MVRGDAGGSPTVACHEPTSIHLLIHPVRER
jgi:hypothetical protein